MDHLPWCDLYTDVITAQKWVHSERPRHGVRVARRVLQGAANEGDRQPVPLKKAALCLRHSLTQASVPYRKWSEDQAEVFMTTVLPDVH
ncbi:hypothetical protein [Streptomyces neyagawaensis]|uniref:Uncharacterized protein n=1 Tax=Streptomyces neyagawaensis TaxID=42238 RepID=A0ABV3BCB0_9ACTN